MQPKETISNVITENNNRDERQHESENKKNYSEENETSEANSIQTQKNKATMKPIPKRPMKNTVSPLDAKIMKFMDSYANNEPKPMNRHASFFNGIIPTLDKFDDDEVIDFQMGVMQLLKKIKSSRCRLESSSSNLASTSYGRGGFPTEEYQNYNTITQTTNVSPTYATASLQSPISVDSPSVTEIDFCDF